MITFSGWEKALGMVRDLEIPVAAIDAVEVAPDGYDATVGLRAPGMSIPGVARSAPGAARGGYSSTQLVSDQRGQPAVVISLRDKRYTDLIIGADDAAALAAGLESLACSRR